jgi:hypothetical protein
MGAINKTLGQKQPLDPLPATAKPLDTDPPQSQSLPNKDKVLPKPISLDTLDGDGDGDGDEIARNAARRGTRARRPTIDSDRYRSSIDGSLMPQNIPQLAAEEVGITK